MFLPPPLIRVFFPDRVLLPLTGGNVMIVEAVDENEGFQDD